MISLFSFNFFYVKSIEMDYNNVNQLLNNLSVTKLKHLLPIKSK